MDVSVVLSTYNRGELLTNALDKLLAQETSGIDHEILIVDNNSTDQTREIASSFVKKDVRFRYIFEKQQGLSCARNAGIAAARSDLIVFCDDDVEASPSWIQQNYESSLRFPDADYIGGRVRPIWSAPAPDWVAKSMSPFALSELGDQPMVVSPSNPHCLVGASLAVRRRALEKAGLFSTTTQRVKNSIGSTEDFDWQMKVWSYGGHGVYDPQIVCATEVPRDRLSKAYHRRWHMGHGKYNAIGNRPQWQGSRLVLGVPLFIYRLTARSAFEFLARAFRGPAGVKFGHEAMLLFYIGFIRQRWKMHFERTPTP